MAFNFPRNMIRPALLLGALLLASNALPPTAAATSSASSFSFNGAKFVTATAEDGAGRLFVATEDDGVWMRNRQGAWTQFTTKNSAIGDDTFYALAIDRQNRVWAGTLRNGVSVFDGKSWKNYGLDNGLVGERVLDLAVSPLDGDVWISTDLGLMRYRVQKDDWVSYTRANGLPSDQIQALAFDAKGTLYAATQCDGLAIADAASGYAKWRRVSGPIRPDAIPFAKALKAPLGLPSSLTNDVLVARSGAIYVATTCGLALSKDEGATWDYGRGRDWADKVRGRAAGLPWARWQPKEGATLSEDYITCLAEDDNGNLWIGHRRTGYEVFNPETGQRLYGGEKDASQTNADYVTGFSVSSSHRVLVSLYGGGVKTSDFNTPPQPSPTSAPKGNVLATAKLPSPSRALSLSEIETQLSYVRRLKTPLPVGAAVYEGEDWRTQGDWLGRYGREYAVLCAARAPLDHHILRDVSYDVQGEIGTHHPKGDSLRMFVAQENADTNPRVLYNPVTGYRRESEWDDHGEAYPEEHEGPDVWAHILVPEGVHRVSAYFYNKDGHEGDNRRRDYLVEMKPDAPTTSKADKLPSLATTRVRDFRGGVYKSFVVRGPAIYWLKVGKNNSHNTILQGILIDKLTGPHTRYDDLPLDWMGLFRYAAPDPYAIPTSNNLVPVTTSSKNNAPSSTRTTQLLSKARLWEFWLDGTYGVEGGALRSQKLRLLILRALNDPKSGATPELLEHWRWKARVWNDADRKSWRDAMKQGHEALLTKNPHLRGVEF